MNNQNENHTLLKTLKELYSQLGVIMTQIRFRSYRSGINSNNNFNITSILNKQVEILASEFVDSSQNTENNKNIVQQSDDSLSKLTDKDQSDIKYTIVSGLESEFAKHLKLSKASAVSHPHMGDKLKKSAWEHIHFAIRFAKQGELEKAKVHADIAGHAVEEASHYLDNTEYSELVKMIEYSFADSKKVQKKEM